MAGKKKKTSKTKDRITKYCKVNGLYLDSDEEIINLYVETYDFYQQMREELTQSSLMMEFTNKVGATNIVKNPLAIEITKVVKTLNDLLKSMGLTPAQRKTALPKPGGDDFEDF